MPLRLTATIHAKPSHKTLSFAIPASASSPSLRRPQVQEKCPSLDVVQRWTRALPRRECSMLLNRPTWPYA